MCAAGVLTCTESELECAQTAFAAPEDTCENGLDDDCDGQVDEGCVGCPPGSTGESCEQCVIYVDGATGSNQNDGTTWGAAKQTITAGVIAATAEQCEVWVTAGNYTPDYKADPFGPDDTATVRLADGVVVRGGFLSGQSDPAARSLLINQTVLSGEIGTTSRTDNILRMVTGVGNSHIDGLVIQGAETGVDCRGTVGAQASITVENSIIRDNYSGSALYSNYCNVTVRNSEILRNQSTSDFSTGGIEVSQRADVVIEDSVFIGNRRNTDYTGGYGAALDAYNSANTVRISGSWFEGGIAEFYGGIYVGGAEVEIVDSTFTGNSDGAALIYVFGGGTALIERTNFVENTGKRGAVRVQGNVLIKDCSFTDNAVNYYSGLDAWGGALLLGPNAVTSVVGSVFEGNFADNLGGAIVVTSPASTQTPGDLYLSMCQFIDNYSDTGGGAISVGEANVYVQSSLFAYNRASYGNGGALQVLAQATSSLLIDSSTFFANAAGPLSNSVGAGGGIFNRETPITITNSILWGNTAKIEGPQILNDEASAVTTLYHSNIQGTGFLGVDGNIDVDPQFVNEALASLDLRLEGGSACIDAGNAVYLSADESDLNDNGNASEDLPFDLTGAARIQGGTPDQGAYEQ